MLIGARRNIMKKQPDFGLPFVLELMDLLKIGLTVMFC